MDWNAEQQREAKALECQCEAPLVDWLAPHCDGTCRRCGRDASFQLTGGRS